MTETLIHCKNCSKITRIDNDKARESFATVKCGHCQSPIFISKYDTIPGLKSSHYQHPLDLKTRSALSKIPGVDTVLKIILREGLVKYQHLFHRQNCIQVNENHLKKYHKMLISASRVLGIEKLPELYIRQDPAPNAYTFGADDHIIVITTSLIDLLDDEEIETVIAHEMGHIHCDHVLYKTAARLLSTLAMEISGRIFGMASSMIYPIVYGLLYWDRTSELSADRAEILVNHDYKVSVRALLNIAGGSQKLKAELDIDEFLKQARETEELTEKNLLEKIYHIIQESQSTHHFPTWRAKEISNWANSSRLFNLLAGQDEKPTNTQGTDSREENQKEKDDSIGFSDIVDEFKKIFSK